MKKKKIAISTLGVILIPSILGVVVSCGNNSETKLPEQPEVLIITDEEMVNEVQESTIHEAIDGLFKNKKQQFASKAKAEVKSKSVSLNNGVLIKFELKEADDYAKTIKYVVNQVKKKEAINNKYKNFEGVIEDFIGKVELPKFKNVSYVSGINGSALLTYKPEDKNVIKTFKYKKDIGDLEWLDVNDEKTTFANGNYLQVSWKTKPNYLFSNENSLLEHSEVITGLKTTDQKNIEEFFSNPITSANQVVEMKMNNLFPNKRQKASTAKTNHNKITIKTDSGIGIEYELGDPNDNTKNIPYTITKITSNQASESSNVKLQPLSGVITGFKTQKELNKMDTTDFMNDQLNSKNIIHNAIDVLYNLRASKITVWDNMWLVDNAVTDKTTTLTNGIKVDFITTVIENEGKIKYQITSLSAGMGADKHIEIIPSIDMTLNSEITGYRIKNDVADKRIIDAINLSDITPKMENLFKNIKASTLPSHAQASIINNTVDLGNGVTADFVLIALNKEGKIEYKITKINKGRQERITTNGLEGSIFGFWKGIKAPQKSDIPEHAWTGKNKYASFDKSKVVVLPHTTIIRWEYKEGYSSPRQEYTQDLTNWANAWTIFITWKADDGYFFEDGTKEKTDGIYVTWLAN